MAYDLLELGGEDLREHAFNARRTQLEKLVDERPRLLLSPEIPAADWPDLVSARTESRARNTEGLMLKRRSSSYGVGRRRGNWWKWKVDPYTIDAVLIYAQAGHGRRSNLFTDYTFALWQGTNLVPVAKAYSGLDQTEIETLDRWIRKHTTERFGPVRAVAAEHVFELAFEGIHVSTRHKSGVAVRFPRIVRWRQDLGIRDADHLEDLERLARG